MTKIVLTDLANLQNETTAVSAINNNNSILETAMDNTLSRDGTSPNQMDATLDMNSNRIINLPIPFAQSEPIRLADVTAITQFQNSVDLTLALASAEASAASAASSANTAVTAVGSSSLPGRFAKLATTTDIPLSGLAAIDGVVPVAGDKILVRNQLTRSQNGLYDAAAGTWSRSSNFNTVPPVQNGAVVNVLQGNTLSNTSWVLSSTDVPIVLGTSLLTITQSTTLNGDVTTYAFQQDGAGTVPLSVSDVLKERYTIQMFGGGTDKTAAQNAAAFVAARNKLLHGGTLLIPPGAYLCDPVSWTRTDVVNYCMTIEGVGSPTNGADANNMIIFTGTGSGTFWNFDAPATGSNTSISWTIKNLFIQASDPTYTGSLISASTSVTDGSRIASNFMIDNCLLIQLGTGACTLLNVGKNIISTMYRTRFIGGATQILGQQGQTVAGTAQARQNVGTDIRKCTFSLCNGIPILFGGEGWGLYDNTFEPTVGGRGRAFTTNANYPVQGMTWINNWFGDVSVAGDQWIVIQGLGFNFIGNFIGGAWSGSGSGSEAINLGNVKGFNISGNSFDGFSNAISSNGTANDGGVIQGNAWRAPVGGNLTSGPFGANVTVSNNVSH